jgi:steroid 5-alpha reductase family enzyme
MTSHIAWDSAATALAVLLLAAVATWLLSVRRKDVSIVDSLWGPMIALSGWTYALTAPQVGPAAVLVLMLATLWAARLTWHITARNWGHGEDRRYQAIRARNEPNFAFKSLYLVFGLQAVLAWVVSLPLMAALAGTTPLGPIGLFGIGLWVFGTVFEGIADWQLARFKSDPQNQQRVMDLGLWRYSRHPNYFGEFCVWWGAWLVAASVGGAWTIVSPLLMTVLLLRISGVSLLEQDIGLRRPGYADYADRTSPFVPWPPRRAAAKLNGEATSCDG